MKNTEIYIKLDLQRECFKKYHEMTSCGVTEEEIDLKIEKSMEIWCEANPEFIAHLEIDLSIFSNAELKTIMWEYAKLDHVESYKKAQEIKNFIESKS